jgi:hypothetical protein
MLCTLKRAARSDAPLVDQQCMRPFLDMPAESSSRTGDPDQIPTAVAVTGLTSFTLHSGGSAFCVSPRLK